MAAPANNRCDKCFATIPAGALTCPDCGAPVGNASAADAEAAVYPELAKANLSRMRGDYKQAEDQLLSVLKRFPNNPSANEMLGDLAAEREDWPHAIQWYEMALEIVPTSASIARKVKDARANIDKKDAQDTTAQLGLPDPKSRAPIFIGVGAVLLILVAAAAYMIGANTGDVASAPNKPVNVIQAQPDGSPKSTPEEGSSSSQPTASPAAGGVAEEQTLLETLRSKAEDAGALVSVTHDPRAATISITFIRDATDHRLQAARIARDAFAALPGYHTITLRGISDGAVTYVADSERARVVEAQTPEWKQQNPDPAWVGHVLLREWPSTPATTAPATPPDGSPDPAAPEGTGGQ